MHSSSLKRTSHSWIARIFYPNTFPWIKQHSYCQVDALLRSIDDDHLFRRAANAASCGEISSNSFSQWKVACCVVIAQGIMLHTTPTPHEKPMPRLMWKGICIRKPGTECSRRSLPYNSSRREKC